MKEFYKILHEDQKHFGMQYHLGLNEDVEPFDETPDCGGGIFFAEKEHVFEYLTYGQGTKLAIIEIPEGEKIIQVDDKYKAHRIIIKDIKDLWTDENYEWLVSYFEINELFLYACENGALSFAKELDKNHKMDIHTKHDYAFRTACKNGHLEVAQWLHSLGVINIHVEDDAAFHLSCTYGHLKVTQWLYNLGGVDIHVYDDAAFRCACANGHLKVARWLHSLGSVNIHAEDDYAFRCACNDGHLEIAKWLQKLGANIHKWDDAAFRWSCENGYLEVAKWLHDLGGVDIHAMDDYVLKYSPEEVITWLNTL